MTKTLESMAGQERKKNTQNVSAILEHNELEGKLSGQNKQLERTSHEFEIYCNVWDRLKTDFIYKEEINKKLENRLKAKLDNNNEEDSKLRKCKEDKTQSEQMLRDMSMNLERENNDRLNELMQVQSSVKRQARTLSNKQNQLHSQIELARRAQEEFRDDEESELKKRLVIKRFY